jgi:hypothetical protein
MQWIAQAIADLCNSARRLDINARLGIFFFLITAMEFA